jgi:hypothetical protein
MSTDDRLLEAIVGRAARKRRVSIDVVWHAFSSVAPELQGRTTTRADLRGALDRLALRGALGLSRSRWETSREPALPAFVVLPQRTSSGLDLGSLSWVPELLFVLDLPLVQDHDELVAINTFLASGGRDRPIVPQRERSLALFGDEKRLEQLMRRPWFARLGLDRLRAVDVPAPLVWERGRPGAPVLVVENHHTWFSFVRWNARTGAYGAVCWGAGKAFYRTVPYLDHVCAEVGASRIEYFGDLDGDGLVIPARNDRPERPIRPALRWYALLLAHGIAAPGSGGVPDDGIAWLGALGPAVEALLSSGRRLAQEAIGTEQLASLGAE